jgi:hypothetical protein
MTSETLVKCGHPPCQCLVEAEQKFCSAECASARGASRVPCLCGHADCVPAANTGLQNYQAERAEEDEDFEVTE